MPGPRYGGTFPSYTNSLIFNDTVVIPVYPIDQRFEAEALTVYQRALPTYKLRLIDADKIIESGGAIHCTTMSFNTRPGLTRPAGETQALSEPEPLASAAPLGRYEEEPELPIRDRSTTRATLSVPALSLRVGRLTVEVELNHSFHDDLRISLRSGPIDAVLLGRGRSGASGPLRFERKYQLPEGFSPEGEWSLSISDLENGDEGRLERWALSFE